MHSRRSALAGLGGLAAATLLPIGPADARSLRKPPRLRLGDTVGLIEPAGFSDDPAHVEGAAQTIRAMGLVPKIGRAVASRFGYLAGTDQQRAADINALFADDSVRAIFAIRGGWGSARLLPYLDWTTIGANPKLLIGSSDVTALHLAIAARSGFPTVHAPNAASGWRKISWDSFWRIAFTGETPTFAPPAPPPVAPGADIAAAAARWRTTTIHPGKARGRLLGGNLSVLAALVGTPWLPDFDGAVLFLEDVGEAEYRIDRMMTQLALAGVLGKVSGVVFGQCARCTAGVPDYIGFTVPQVLEQHLAPLGVPAFHGANIGHVANQFALPSGVEVEIDAAAGSIRMLEPAVR